MSSLYKVVFVDDERQVRNQAAFYFGMAHGGLDFHIMKNTEELLKYAELIDFSLVITDNAMPGMDGTEAVRQLRESPEFARRYSDTPIVIYSSSDNFRTRQQAGLGKAEFISKSVPLDVMVDAVLERHIYSRYGNIPKGAIRREFRPSG